VSAGWDESEAEHRARAAPRGREREAAHVAARIQDLAPVGQPLDLGTVLALIEVVAGLLQRLLRQREAEAALQERERARQLPVEQGRRARLPLALLRAGGSHDPARGPSASTSASTIQLTRRSMPAVNSCSTTTSA
jgi:hypothetical protein